MEYNVTVEVFNFDDRSSDKSDVWYQYGCLGKTYHKSNVTVYEIFV